MKATVAEPFAPLLFVLAACGSSHVESITNRASAVEVWIQRTHQESAISADRRFHVITRTLTLNGRVATLEVRTVWRDRNAPGDPWRPESLVTLTGSVSRASAQIAIDLGEEHWSCTPRPQPVAAATAMLASTGENAAGAWTPPTTTSIDTLACHDLIDFGPPPGIENACATNVGCGLRRVPSDGAITPVIQPLRSL